MLCSQLSEPHRVSHIPCPIKNDPPFFIADLPKTLLLHSQICMSYRLDIHSIFEKLTKTPKDHGRALRGCRYQMKKIYILGEKILSIYLSINIYFLFLPIFLHPSAIINNSKQLCHLLFLRFRLHASCFIKSLIFLQRNE